MKHQDGIVAEYLNPQWEQATQRLAEAAICLVRANEEYQQAIIARIALSEQLNNI